MSSHEAYSPTLSPYRNANYSPTMSPYINHNTNPQRFVVKDFKPAPIKLDNLKLLEGQNNYEDWASQMSMAFKPMGVYDIVVNGVHPVPDATDEEHEACEALSNHAMLVLIQVISKPILKKISKLSTPHEGAGAGAAAVVPPALNAAAITAAMQSVVDALELPMQAYADVLLRAEWREMTAVAAYFAAVDPNTCVPLNPLTPIFPWRGPALPEPEAHSFARTSFTSFAQCVEDVARGRQVREITIALTNFEDDAAWVPLRHMGISSTRHLELWGATMGKAC